MKPVPVPRALQSDEIKQVVEQFYNAAELAREAGFDGVEIHGANGYLLDQFLRDGSNLREDEYGGSLANRLRVPLEVVAAVAQVFALDQIGYRISPNNPFHGMADSDPVNTFSELTQRLDEIGIGYLHIFEYLKGHEYGPTDEQTVMTPLLRKLFKNTYIVNGGYLKESAESALATGQADMVAFGVPFLANPDLPERFLQNAKLNDPDRDTFYQGEAKGYTDYPTLT